MTAHSYPQNNHPDAALQILSDEQIVKYQVAIAKWHPNLGNVWCTMDGLKLYFEHVLLYSKHVLLVQWIDTQPLHICGILCFVQMEQSLL